MKKFVITGVNGFVGKHLARELADNDISVVGIGQEANAHDDIRDLVREYYRADLTKEWPVEDRIDAVIHLAGLAAVGPSFSRPQDYINLNSAMLTNMAEHYLGKDDCRPRLVIVSSGAVYSPDQPMPLTETSVAGYSSPYVVSKLLVEAQSHYYRTRGLDCVIARPFNHIGPGQNEGFLVPDMIEQLREAEDQILVGNIDTKRDYTDVRDVVAAYRELATSQRLDHDTYNVCSGKSVAGRDIIEALKKIMRKQPVAVVVDDARVRPTDPANIFGDSSRLRDDTGWAPKISLEQTLVDCVKG